MPESKLPEDIYFQVAEFTRLFEAVNEEKIGFDEPVGSIMKLGIDTREIGLHGPLDETTLFGAFKKLGSPCSTHVDRYVAHTLDEGAILRENRDAALRK